MSARNATSAGGFVCAGGFFRSDSCGFSDLRLFGGDSSLDDSLESMEEESELSLLSLSDFRLEFSFRISR